MVILSLFATATAILSRWILRYLGRALVFLYSQILTGFLTQVEQINVENIVVDAASVTGIALDQAAASLFTDGQGKVVPLPIVGVSDFCPVFWKLVTSRT